MATDARKHRVLSGISKQFCCSIQKFKVSERKNISFYEVTAKTYENLIYYVALLKHIAKDGYLILFALHKCICIIQTVTNK